MTKFFPLILTIIILCGCTKQNSDIQIINGDDYYSIINELISDTYNDVGVVVTDLNKISVINNSEIFLQLEENGDTTIIDNSIYGKKFFVSLYKKGLIDTIDIDFMYNQIESEQMYKLDPSKIQIQTLGIDEIHSLFKNAKTSNGYEKLLKKYKVRSFLVISEPLFSRDKQEILIDVEHYCGRLCGTGITYLFKKKNGVWTIIYSKGNWIS